MRSAEDDEQPTTMLVEASQQKDIEVTVALGSVQEGAQLLGEAIPAHRSISATVTPRGCDFLHILNAILVDWFDPPGKEKIMCEVLVDLVVGCLKRLQRDFQFKFCVG